MWNCRASVGDVPCASQQLGPGSWDANTADQEEGSPSSLAADARGPAGRGRGWLLAPPPARGPAEWGGGGAGSWLLLPPSSLPFDLLTFRGLSHSGSKLSAVQVALKLLFLLRVTYSSQKARTEGSFLLVPGDPFCSGAAPPLFHSQKARTEGRLFAGPRSPLLLWGSTSPVPPTLFHSQKARTEGRLFAGPWSPLLLWGSTYPVPQGFGEGAQDLQQCGYLRR